jgi:glycosyl transferase, family 25
MKIFVIHYAKLVERRKNMVRQLLINDLEAEFVTQYDKDKLSNIDKNKFTSKCSYPAISLALKHLFCYREINDKYDYALVLEDDAIFNNKFKEKIHYYISQLPNEWDMLFIGDGCNLHIPYDIVRNSNMNVFKKCLEPTLWGGNGATRCTDSYLISKKCAAKIIEFFDHTTIDNAIDWWLNDVCRKYNFNVYWAEPTIVSQGSENGMYKSTL